MPYEEIVESAKPSRPPQFTLANVLWFVVVAGVILAVVRSFGSAAGAVLAIITLLIAPLRYPQVPQRASLRLLLVACLSLGTWLFGVFSAVIVPLCAGFLLARFRLGLLALYVALAPFGPSFVQGVVDYLRGEAKLRTTGGPLHPEDANPDPQWRCAWQSSGCVVRGDEWMFHDPYNVAVKTMIRVFGYMPNAYTGPYPSREEAHAAQEAAVYVRWEDLKRDRLVLGDSEYALTPGTGNELRLFPGRDRRIAA